MYNLGYFKMPDPVGLKDDKDWLEIPRISKTIPFGYEEHKKDDKLLVPIVEELEALELAKEYLNEYSYREVAGWLSERTGREISTLASESESKPKGNGRVKQRLIKHGLKNTKLPSRNLKKLRASVQERRRKKKEEEKNKPKPEVTVKETVATELPLEEQHNILFQANEGHKQIF